MAENNSKYFSILDSYRFYAFLLVFVSHMIVFLNFPPKDMPFIKIFNTFTQTSALGVAFFFVLSGFLINYLLENERKASKSGNISIKGFYARRVLRIWPLYFFAIFIIYILSLLILSVAEFKFYEIFINAKEFLYHIFMSGSVYRGLFGTDNDMLAVLWSISVEEQFYLIWPILFFKFRKNILLVIATILAISSVSRYYYFGDYDALRYLTHTIMSYLMIGAAAGIYYEKILNLLSKYRKIVFRSSIFLILAAIFVKGYIYEFNLPITLEILLPLIFGSLFAILIVLGTQNKIGSRNIHHKITVYLGTISYGLYVYHMIALTLVLFILNRLNIFSSLINQNMYSFMFIFVSSFILTIMISYLSFKYIEKPFLKFKRRFT